MLYEMTENTVQRLKRWSNMGFLELARRSAARISGRAKQGNCPLRSLPEVTRFAMRLVETDRTEIERIYSELGKAPFAERLQKFAESSIEAHSHFGVDEALYVLCRLLRPQVVVETGVCLGISSAHILYAIQKNGSGRLFSIDLPFKSLSEEPGSFVPSELRREWTFLKGASRDLLPYLAEKMIVDVFMHDSEHSYSNMLFEYKTIWPSIRSGGLLLSDDVYWTRAFSKFASEKRQEIAVKTSCFGYRMGALRKR
jgi:predicted O-methyltransferase YrrM